MATEMCAPSVTGYEMFTKQIKFQKFDLENKNLGQECTTNSQSVNLYMIVINDVIMMMLRRRVERGRLCCQMLCV